MSNYNCAIVLNDGRTANYSCLICHLSLEDWFPDLQKAFWGMQSDGFCRIATRADSAPVVKRNWHWGPLIHQTFADSFGLLFSRAIRLALEDLAAGKMPPEPPGIDNYERILNESNIDDEKTQTWKKCMCSICGFVAVAIFE